MTTRAVAPPPDPDAIARAAAAVVRGELVCVATETTYGLAADIRNRRALDRLVALKGRDPRAPFGLIVPDVAAAVALCRVWPAAAAELAAAHWPGPLTLVAPARADLPAEIVGPGGGVGVRVSSHPWAAALARAVGGAITATSANRSGEVPALSAERARWYFGDDVAVYLDAGAAAAVSASTVVAVDEGGRLTLLRRGVVAVGTGSAHRSV